MSFDLFANVTFDRLKSLYELSKNNSRNISNLKITYNRNHNFFHENFNFLIDIHLFKDSDYTLHIGSSNVKGIKSISNLENKMSDQTSLE